MSLMACLTLVKASSWTMTARADSPVSLVSDATLRSKSAALLFVVILDLDTALCLLRPSCKKSRGIAGRSTERLAEQVKGLIAVEHGQGVRQGELLLMALLGSVPVVSVGLLAFLLEIKQEIGVRLQRFFRVLEIPLVVGKLLLRIGQFVGLLGDLLVGGFDLGVLSALQCRVVFLVLSLLLLAVLQVLLKLLLHLLQHPEDLPGLRTVGAEHVGLGGLHEGLRHLLLFLPDQLRQEPLRMLRYRFPQQILDRHQGSSVVLGQHSDGRLQRRN
mmetsp:Transcript_30080/g.77479  ORF Transcript_30080/g.77479 Transcript_30080/m.77479 type:complete len:273 (-) Transcript_30080:500-1318(-)